MAFIKVGALITALVLGWSAVRAQPVALPPPAPSVAATAGPGAG